MSGPPPNKRQKRAQYRKAQEEAQNTEGGEVKLPKKKFYRQRAHANPFSDHKLDYPISPAHMNWAAHFPAFVDPDPEKTTLSGARKLVKDVEVVDIGCGFGGLLVGLAPLMPDTLMIGMEIRTQVLDYLRTRIHALRSQQQKARGISTSSTTSRSSATPAATSEGSPQPSSSSNSNQADTAASPLSDAPSLPDTTASVSPSSAVPGGYQNISALRANTMKFLPNFFARHQLSKIFICFPDPHFKARKHKARIISSSLNAEYAYVLRPGGLLYTITDVEEYHLWILRHFGQRTTTTEGAKDENEAEVDQEEEEEEETEAGVLGVRELWERVPNEELENDECVRVMKEETEEGKKVTRNNGPKFVAVFRRRPDPDWSGSASSSASSSVSVS
ncbi:hypothetical protein VTN77DRAFT_6692 [Rasamsonia byssochlamydoides]|uniref:uncharacterized protein n=1 Tax=Rasamsonia byssochlamydoides TaxID=89139 RepID=UPI0037447CDE